jgi:hypothetical protein
MIKLKHLLASTLLAASGMASAEMIRSLYNPIYNPPAGYENGCEKAYFYSYSGGGYNYIARMKNNEGFWLYTGSTWHYISCSNGIQSASGEAYEGELVPY